MHDEKKFLRFLLILIILICVNLYPQEYITSYSKQSSIFDNGFIKFDVSTIIPLDSSHIIIESSGDYIEGHNLMMLTRKNKSTNLVDCFLAIIDMEGNIIREKYVGSKANYAYLDVDIINSTTILYDAMTGCSLWNFYTDVEVYFDISGHHEYEYNPNDNTIFTIRSYVLTIDDVKYQFESIEEADLNGDIVWSLKSDTFISVNQWCIYQDMQIDAADIVHGNTVFYDADEDVIYFNSRNTNTFYKIDHSTSNVIWGLGGYGDFTLFDKYGHERDNLFYHAHAVEQIDDNEFILFDNDKHNITNVNNKISRMIEISINIETMTANETWSWESPPTYYSDVWGDADRLPNNHRLGCFGTYTHFDNTDIGAILVEVNDTDVVWEMKFSSNYGYQYGIYRAERINYAPIIEDINDFEVFIEDDVEISWDTFYNFRPKKTVQGTYIIYVNNTFVASGDVFFDKFWREVKINYNFGKLALGTYNVTLVLNDEMGHTSQKQTYVTIVPFYITRSGPTIIEKLQNDSTVYWEGETTSPLNFEIIRNSSSYKSGSWNNQRISEDLNDWLIGEYFVQFELYNSSLLVFNDSFWITIYPLEKPEVLTNPINQTIIWGESLTLSWEIFDQTPAEWQILVNGDVYKTRIWENKNELVTWVLPTLNEDVYDITLIISDCANQETKSTVWITINSPSPPIIADVPTNTDILWNQDTTLIWEVHGGNVWNLYVNDSLDFTGAVNGNYISVDITDWKEGKWLPGKYNVTLEVVDIFHKTITSTIWITISFQLGDAYADEFISSSSIYYTNGENALGPTDGNYAQIYQDYSNGILTLDMGLNEEILDGAGDDFTVHGGEGEYFVKVGNSLSQPFVLIGIGSGNQNFDLASIGYSSARYVQIEFRSGSHVEIDAIEAIHYNLIEIDDENPTIIAIEDCWVWENQSSIELVWEAYDLTPWNYSIFINGSAEYSTQWDGSSIIYEFLIQGVGNTTITLEVYDLFGNIGQSTLNIEVKRLPQLETTKSDYYPMILMPLIIFSTIRFITKKRGKR